jgi:hypothetical protein
MSIAVPPFEWMNWLVSHLGEEQWTGKPASAFVKECFSHTNYKLHGITEPSCAATACAALEHSGYKSPHSARAVSFKDYGVPHAVKPGAIIVFEWDSGDHHVTFCNRIIDEMHIECLGGNQHHHLQISTYNTRSILASRWPIK